MTGDLLREAEGTNRDLSSLMTVGGGGAPRAPEQVKQIDASFAKALPKPGWGMTETNAIGTGIGGRDYLERPASSGRCSAVLELKVIEEGGVELPAGERGELLVRGTALVQGYWNRPDSNAGPFDDGWCRTRTAGLPEHAGWHVRVRGQVTAPGGGGSVEAERQGPASEGAAMGLDAARELRARGGADFFKALE